MGRYTLPLLGAAALLVSGLAFAGTGAVADEFKWMTFAVFGAIIALSGCWFGMRAGRGAAGVGRATTNSVVAASVGILASNFILTSLFFT